MKDRKGAAETHAGACLRLRNTRLTVHLAAYRQNIALLKKAVAPAMLMAVVKANAYGHGLVQMAEAAVASGTEWLGVATADEGIALRNAGLGTDILVLGTVNREGARACTAHDLTMTVADCEGIRSAQEAAVELRRTTRIHLKLDTGMGRIGVRSSEEVRTCMDALAASPDVALTGVFTHLADADNPEPAFTDSQLRQFDTLRAALPGVPIVHAAASAAALTRPDARFDMVRIGIAGYGYPTVPTALPLHKCLTWTAEVAFVKDVAAGSTIGYGCTFRAQQHLRVATLAVGYGDGYPRALSGRAHVLIHGVRCPVIGRICMDQMMVDITRAPAAKPGDDAVLLGFMGSQSIDADDLAVLLGTIPYEVLLLPSARVPVTYDEE